MTNIKKIIIAIIIFALLLISGFVGAIYWLNAREAAELEAEEHAEEVHIISHEMTEAIVVNIMNSNKYLRVKPILKLKDNVEKDKEILAIFGLAESGGGHGGEAVVASGDGVLKPTFNIILRSKSLEEIQQPNSLITFGEEIAKELNSVFNCDTFQAVEFAEFIYQ